VSKLFTNIHTNRLHLGVYKRTEMAVCTLYNKKARDPMGPDTAMEVGLFFHGDS
jgi:hypothetical protein